MKTISSQTSLINPMVSVAMITYNHEKFISQAIESVLMQETDFTVELIIGEDCSLDTTREIIYHYAARYPHIIRTLLHVRNIGAGRNAAAVLNACHGKYIAMLEGDDYWTDKFKLKKQVEFMEKEPECAICHHRVLAVMESSGEAKYEFPPEIWRKPHTEGVDLLKVNFVQTCSALYRAVALPTITERLINLKLLDWPIAILSAQKGWIGFLDSCMAVYRLHASSKWQVEPYEKRCYYTLEMLRQVDIAVEDDYHDRIVNQLDETWIKLASPCNFGHQPVWTKKVAIICLKRALGLSTRNRLRLVRQAIRLVIPKANLHDRIFLMWVC